MSKIHCDIVKDLLPLYKDEICSEKSKDMIEDHLAECEDCRNYLGTMNLELPPVTPGWKDPDSQKDSVSYIDLDVDFLNKVAKKVNWMKLIVCSFALMAAWMIAVIVKNLILSEYFPNIPIFDKSIPIEDVQVTELYQLEDGRLFFTLETDTLCNPFFYSSITSPDQLPVFADYDNAEIALSLEKVSWWEQYVLSRFGTNKFSFAFPLEEEYRYEDGNTIKTAVHKSVTAYLKGKNNEQLVLWEEGQEIESAPDEVEEIVIEAQKKETKDDVEDYATGPIYYHTPITILYDSSE